MPAAPSTSLLSTPDWAQVLRAAVPVSRNQTRALVVAMAALHIGVGWALLQVPGVRQPVMDTAPLMVEWLAPPALPRDTPPPPSQVQAQVPPPVQPPPVLAAPSPAPVPTDVFSVPPPPPVPAETTVAAAPVVTPAPTAPPAPAPASPKRAVATAVSYALQPPVEVPLAPRRAGESGVVWLRVVVSTRGLPMLVQVQRSSGHARLDEQAVWAMRQARFIPHTEDGRAIEVEVVAPIEYSLE